ncbi:hypothetical protein pdam_00024965 [Pocillopora damicornis]|uniref:Uncharacterized protein n=1 Tax=Pocillopora damicornis TaxID=46731 RepID=A0A3M6TZ51_POCDA|nr:hypothetical protein pdam_00024965 [Pocillopora damicornis]
MECTLGGKAYMIYVAWISSCLKQSVQRNVNLSSVYDDKKPVPGFRREAMPLGHSACEGSRSKDSNS